MMEGEIGIFDRIEEGEEGEEEGDVEESEEEEEIMRLLFYSTMINQDQIHLILPYYIFA